MCKMNYENTNYNEILIFGTINNIKKLLKYIVFRLTCNTHSSNNKSKWFISFHIYENLYNIYKDFFKVFVKGYLNTYIDKGNKIMCYIK